MKLLVTGTTGFLGSRAADLLEERGHELRRLGRPDDAGDPSVRDLLAGCDAALHFAGVPNPTAATGDPARAVRENVGATLNLLEGCLEHDVGLVYPSTVRAGLDPLPDAYAISKRLGEEVCRLHAARALVVRLTSVYGPGQVAWEGATGAIAAFAARALEGAPIVIAGDPDRTRDFVYVDDAITAIEVLIDGGRWNQTVVIASGRATPLRAAAELVREAARSESPIETPEGELPAGENASYGAAPEAPLPLKVPLDEGVRRYVDWLAKHPAAEGRSRA